MSFGKSRAKRMSAGLAEGGGKDVAGADEAVEELQEIKEFLENPKKFQALGARIPKGVSSTGRPAPARRCSRATAGEAGRSSRSPTTSSRCSSASAPRASATCSSRRSRRGLHHLHRRDRRRRRHRGAGLGGGHDEREQTLNQLLVEMDRFELKDNIILIAATNRPDILDPALLRPGRFDQQIVVDTPDRKGRKEILEVHAKGKPLDKDIELDVLAAGTPGFTGADLANVINEAALLAARRGHKVVGQDELKRGSCG